MRRIYPWLITVFTFSIGALIIGPLGNLVYDHWYNLALLKDIADLLALWWVLPLVPVAGLLSLWAYIDRVSHERRHEFALIKPAKKLRPKDLGFQRLKLGEKASIDSRPHYPLYIPRRAVNYEVVFKDLGTFNSGDNSVQRVYDEDALRKLLVEGHGLVLLGQPLDGKTRTAYELIRRMEGYMVVVPHKDRPVPIDDAFSSLKKKRVLVLLDDLNDYADAALDLRMFQQKVSAHSRCCAIVATCREGAEFWTVQQANSTR